MRSTEKDVLLSPKEKRKKWEATHKYDNKDIFGMIREKNMSYKSHRYRPH
jgi:hypothetical protein